MQNGIRLNGKRADFKGLVDVDVVVCTEFMITHGIEGTNGQPDRQAVTSRQTPDPIGMITMFMRHQNRAQGFRRAPQPQQPAFGFGNSKAAIHQDTGCPGLNQCRITPAAASQYGKAQHGDQNRVCRRLRMSDATASGAALPLRSPTPTKLLCSFSATRIR